MRRGLLLGALAVALLLAGWALRRHAGAREPWRDGRLLAHLAEAVEVPPPPPPHACLRVETLPPVDASQALLVPFTAEPARGLVARIRLQRAGEPLPSAELFTLDDAEAERVGAHPVPQSGSPPGKRSGPFRGSASLSGDTVVLQRFDHLPLRVSHAVIVIHGPFAGGAVEVDDAELPDTRGPEGPALSPLVRRAANRVTGSLSWRSGLAARPGGRYVFDAPIPPSTSLTVGLGHEMGGWRAPGRFRVLQDDQVLFDEQVAPDDRWHDLVLPLRPSRLSRLVLESSAVPGASGAMRGLWSVPRLRTDSERPNLLLITVDALRADHVGAYGYARDTTPTLDALARAGVIFEKATAQANRTWESVSSLMSGRYPANSGVRFRGQDLPVETPILGEFLSQQGYETFTGTDLASFPGPTLAGFDEAQIVLDDPKVNPGRQFEHLVDHFRRGGTFAWIHLENAHYPLLPKQPLRYDPGYQGRFRERFTQEDHRAVPRSSDVTAAEQVHLIALYDAGIRDADEDIREMLGALDRAGQLEHTLVVVTADHGEQLGDHGAALEHIAPYNVTLHVPLVVAWPDHIAAGARFDSRVQLIDLFPTIAHLLELTPPGGMDGRDLAPWIRGGEQKSAPAFSEVEARVFSVFDGDDHLIVNTSGRPLHVDSGAQSEVRARELYDVRDDPAEVHDLAAAKPERVERLLQLLEQKLQAWQQGTSAAPPTIGQAAAEALRQAGYLQDAPLPPLTLDAGTVGP